MASGGDGTSIHVAGEVFKMMTGVKMLDVPYRGVGASFPDLIAGHVQVMFDSMPGSIEFIRTSRLRALAVTMATRSPALPDLPTVGDFVPGYEASPAILKFESYAALSSFVGPGVNDGIAVEIV